MTDVLPEAFGLISAAGVQLLEHGLLGALLVISLVANGALMWALLRCWRFHRGADRHDDIA